MTEIQSGVDFHSSHFYSHAREGRDSMKDEEFDDYIDFYSHAREGRDIHNSSSISSNSISTHTPARGVTYAVHPPWKEINISTHTPARGVTLFCIMGHQKQSNFYSHAREGRDTPGCWPHPCPCFHFYSHAREGRDCRSIDCKILATPFLLTRPRGA